MANMITESLLSGRTYDKILDIYRNIPKEYRKNWIEGHPTQSDPLGTRHPSPDDVKQIVSAWGISQSSRFGPLYDPLYDPLMGPRGTKGDTGPLTHDDLIRTQNAMNDIHNHHMNLGQELIEFFEKKYPKEENFMKMYAEKNSLGALEAVRDMIRRCMEVGMSAEVKTATSGINNELKRLEEERNELHRTSSKRDKQRDEHTREGKGSIYPSPFSTDVPF